MVNLAKWEEVDFFDIKLNDEIKYVQINGLKTTVIRGKVVFRLHRSDATGTLRIEDGHHQHDLSRRDFGKPEGTTLYRRKAKTFELPTEFGAIVSAVYVSRYSEDKRQWFVFDGQDWCSGDSAVIPTDFEDNYKDHILEREGVTVPNS